VSPSGSNGSSASQLGTLLPTDSRSPSLLVAALCSGHLCSGY
jgi:hypothetical protein